MSSLTVHLAESTAKKLDKVAARLDQSNQRIASQAIDDFVQREDEQLADIEAGLAEADRGDFADPSEIDRIRARYLKDNRSRS